ncbi:5-hydroxytryptamine receptor 3C-like [Sturnira hondurensis]|uniref:5-hydroxytryptamine receptor 3C-like n=1 Tax=Sturnira hondurensis TaxID=192404 RepID=UPI001879E16E|nr:5-hydroxytryptamine receptor 3C-like [Sturnira hondurensis]
MEGGWPTGGGLLLCLTVSLLLQGRASTFTISCSGFDQHGVDLVAFQTVFKQKDFRPVINYSIPTQVNISFTLSAIWEVNAQFQLLTSFLWLKMTWNNPFMRWDPGECGHLNKLTVTTENLWLPDICIIESREVDQTMEGLSAYVVNTGHTVYSKPMQVTSICSLDIFFFPFDQQNCTFTFGFVLYTVENMLLGMEKEVWERADTSSDTVCTQGQWDLLSINKAAPKMNVGSSLFDQIMFYVAIKRRSKLYVINLLVPSSFLVAIDALSFYLPAESENRAPFKITLAGITLLLGYNIFLLMMNKLLPANGTPLISVYFALCLSLMLLSLLETIFITYLLHLPITQPAPMPPWLHPLLLYCTSPRKCCPTALWTDNVDPGLIPTHMSGLKGPRELVGKKLEPREEELNGSSGLTRAQLTDLWVQFSRTMDTFLFRLYLLFLASSITTVIVL